jgi:hypothetical protein
METAIVRAAGRESPAILNFRRFALLLLGCVAPPPLLRAGSQAQEPADAGV